MDTISPELALVDPELRRDALASLDPHQFVFTPARVRAIPAVPTVGAPPWPRSWARHGAQLLQLLGLLVGGILVANVAARNASDRPVLLTNSTSVAEPKAPPSGPLDNPSEVERALLQLIVQSPATRLPRALINTATGLAINNLQAVCHPTAAGGYLCVVRPALHKPGEGIHVRYGPNGFTWSPYRSD